MVPQAIRKTFLPPSGRIRPEEAHENTCARCNDVYHDACVGLVTEDIDVWACPRCLRDAMDAEASEEVPREEEEEKRVSQLGPSRGKGKAKAKGQGRPATRGQAKSQGGSSQPAAAAAGAQPPRTRSGNRQLNQKELDRRKGPMEQQGSRVLRQREQELNASGRQELHYLVEPKAGGVHAMTEARWLPASLVDKELLGEYRRLQEQAPAAEVNMAVTSSDSSHAEKLVEDFHATRTLHDRLGVEEIQKKKKKANGRRGRGEKKKKAVVEAEREGGRVMKESGDKSLRLKIGGLDMTGGAEGNEEGEPERKKIRTAEDSEEEDWENRWNNCKPGECVRKRLPTAESHHYGVRPGRNEDCHLCRCGLFYDTRDVMTGLTVSHWCRDDTERKCEGCRQGTTYCYYLYPMPKREGDVIVGDVELIDKEEYELAERWIMLSMMGDSTTGLLGEGWHVGYLPAAPAPSIEFVLGRGENDPPPISCQQDYQTMEEYLLMMVDGWRAEYEMMTDGLLCGFLDAERWSTEEKWVAGIERKAARMARKVYDLTRKTRLDLDFAMANLLDAVMELEIVDAGVTNGVNTKAVRSMGQLGPSPNSRREGGRGMAWEELHQWVHEHAWKMGKEELGRIKLQKAGAFWSWLEKRDARDVDEETGRVERVVAPRLETDARDPIHVDGHAWELVEVSLQYELWMGVLEGFYRSPFYVDVLYGDGERAPYCGARGS